MPSGLKKMHAGDTRTVQEPLYACERKCWTKKNCSGETGMNESSRQKHENRMIRRVPRFRASPKHSGADYRVLRNRETKQKIPCIVPIRVIEPAAGAPRGWRRHSSQPGVRGPCPPGLPPSTGERLPSQILLSGFNKCFLQMQNSHFIISFPARKRRFALSAVRC